jgi:hypothetical protein
MTTEKRRMTTESPSVGHDRDGVLERGLGDLLARGAIAGLSSGLVFLVANMGWAVRDDKPAVAPMIDIATIFHNQDMPMPVEALEFGPDNLVVGLTTHLMLSVFFGIGFALIAAAVLRDRGAGLLALAGIGYGVLLYVVNFQVLGRLFFEWFTDPMGPPQVFEAFIHGVFGLLLVPFFLGAVGRSQGRPARA